MKIITYNNKAVRLDSGKFLQSVDGCAYIVINCNKTGATLTCGSQTYTLTGAETSHAFQAQSGTYTCTASLTGYETVTSSVVVSANTVYISTLRLSKVPAAYQEVEYLQSIGGQYINLNGYVDTADGDYSVELLYTPMSLSPSMGSYAGIYGADNNLQLANNGSYASVGNVSSSSEFFTPGVSALITATFSATQGSTTYYVNGTDTGLHRASAAGITNYLFTTSAERYYCIGKMYYFKAVRDGSSIVELYPCYRKSDSVTGMYDIVSGTFLTNAGSGVFTAGPDI